MPKKIALREKFDGATLDSLYSTLASFGQGKASQTYFIDSVSIDVNELTAMYEGNWLAHKIVRKPVHDALRPGIEISSKDDENELATFLKKRWYELDCVERLKDAKSWARLYGGGALILIVEERKATDLWRPLIPANVRRILDLRVADAFELIPNTYYTDPLKAKYGEPRTYTYSPTKPGVSAPSITIHESRIIRFDGDVRPSRTNQNAVNNLWGASILQPMYDTVLAAAIFEDCTTELATDFVSRVFKMSNLADLVANKKDAQISARVQLISKTLSPHKTAVIDKDEELDKKQAPISGYKELIDFFADGPSGASGIPRAVLYSQQLGTLAGAEETTATYHDLLLDVQDSLTKQVDRLIEVMLLEECCPKGATAEGYEWEWNSITKKNKKAEADARNVQADIDKKYIELGVYTAEEVRDNRFASGEYSFATQVEGDLPDPDPVLVKEEAERQAAEKEKKEPAAE